MNRIIQKVTILLLPSLLIPVLAHAHVKWFTERDPVKESIESILSPSFISMALLTAIVLGVLPQVIPRLMSWKASILMDHSLEKYRPYVYPILRIGLALSLTIQLFFGTIFAPEIEVARTGVILGIAIILLLLIPHHLATKLGALGLFFMFINQVMDMGVFYMLDYGFYVAIVVALLLRKTTYEHWGMPFLYLGTGLSLCWVAIEKWVYPGMSLDIIETHHVPTFGFPPEMFITMSAFIEFVVGYLLVVGVLNRLLALVLTVIFIMTTTLFGFIEVIGHFMFHVILIIFIIEGVSFYNPPIRIHKSKIDQIIFVSLNFLFVLATMTLIYYRFA